MFGNLFKSHKKEESDNKSVSISKSLFDNYISTKKEIKHLEDKYNDFIIRSLEVEFEQYKQYIDSSFPSINGNRPHWSILEMKYDKFTLDKKDKNNDIQIQVDYSFYEDLWELKKIDVNVGWNSTKLNKNKIDDIIFQYFIYWKHA